MREEEFKQWLKEEKGITDKSLSTRLHAVRTIEKKLADLGFTQEDLDEVVEDDDFDRLRERIEAIRQDATGGGSDFKILMPESDAPLKRLPGWKSWLGQYEDFIDVAAQPTSESFAQQYQIWDEFLETWPIDRLRSMELEEYTTAGDKDCFVYWIEARLGEMGSIWGGSAFKFGIYSRRDTAAKEDDTSRCYSDEYGWYRRLGNTTRDTFENVRSTVVSIAENAQKGDLAAIKDETRLGQSLKWKIAFHYQGRENPTIVNIFKKKSIQDYLGDTQNTSLDKLHPQLIEQKSNNQGILEYGAEVWKSILDKQDHSKSTVEDDHEMTDEELLARFDGDEAFRSARVSWNDEKKQSFCSIARTIHNAGLDWYHTKIPQIRFGRKENANGDASGTLGSVQLRTEQAFLEFSHQHERLGLEGRYDFDAGGSQSLISAIENSLQAISSWKPAEPNRPGKWPDQYEMDEAEMSESESNIKPINLILYGPPGTGKTYRTAREAVSICDGTASKTRDELMKRYDELIAEERIAFVTFHQNYAYEDFVEGLRPSQEDEDGERIESGFRLAPEAGIFRKISERAQVLRSDKQNAFDLTGRRIFKISLGEAAKPEQAYLFDEALAGGFVHIGDDGGMDWTDERFQDKQSMIDGYAEAHDGERLHPNSGLIEYPFRLKIRARPGDIVIVTKGNLLFRAIGVIKGDYEQVTRAEDNYTMRRSVNWLWEDMAGVDHDVVCHKRFSQVTMYEFASSDLKLDAIAALIDEQNAAGEKKEKQLPYVLIIDEINRANISKVFGELITLIEPDKRLGQDNALTVTLPYSKKTFGVPSNLHIVGTMNTADRSIALLDTALRRRFKFREIAPNPKLLNTVDGIDLEKLLSSINKRIEYLVDRDHRIGHAFFMRCNNRNDIDLVMRDNVIPLLQEYFFEDWSRVRSVVGAGFIGSNQLDPPPGIEGDKIPSYYVRCGEGPDRFGFPSGAYETLLNGKSGSENANPDNQG